MSRPFDRRTDPARDGGRRGDRSDEPRLGWGRAIASIAVLAAFVLLGRDHLGELDRLADASPGGIAGLLAAFAVARVARGLAFQVLLTRLDRRVTLAETTLLGFLVSYTNLIVPKAGLGAPALYFQRRHDVAYASFGAVMLVIVLVQTVVVGALGLGLTLAERGRVGPDVTALVGALFGIVALGGAALMALRPTIPERWSGRIAGFLRRAARSWQVLGSNLGLTARIAATAVLVVAASALQLQFAFVAVGADVRFSGVLMATLLSELALLVSVTPGALGFREAAVTAAALWLEATPSVALAAAILDRIVTTIAIVGVGQIGLWSLGRRSPRSGEAESG